MEHSAAITARWTAETDQQVSRPPARFPRRGSKDRKQKTGLCKAGEVKPGEMLERPNPPGHRGSKGHKVG